MSPLSKWPLTTDEQIRIRNLFLNELVKISDKDEMESLMKSLLSESEYFMVAKRLVAFVLIDKDYSDVQIAKMLHLTRATVNKFRTIYKYSRERRDPVVKVVERMKISEAMKNLLKEVLLKYAIPAALGRIPKKGIF
ncbi:MAG: hypothetical protein UU93_C0006G0027 [Candidatus Amesbacteria bacterium GW2011_GWA2_42_12]|uniref:TrpR like protein, YerC/YecD n=1 Tax=Candidatus Amesbacteria bacterium GW2011_GWA2_42_12 TaxID=1618356 RepID=A0A0G1B4S8_9BACT|nr:MAG: hypothetical protein UU93_C0006G0027 [Candidatus Amesbacteria bacterium GW2011_GWA2_42_12]